LIGNGEVMKRKWIVLLVILILVVPYEVKTEPGYGHPDCVGRQNTTEVRVNSLTYEYYSDSICWGLIHYYFAFPAGEPKNFRIIFMWTAVGDSDGHYQFWVFDYRDPNGKELIYWLPRLK